MSTIAVITDSDASLPPQLAARFGIPQVPMNVHFGQETLISGIDIDDARLFTRIDREKMIPTTSAPSPGRFAAEYQAAFDRGANAVLCFCVSSVVSGTYIAALLARDMMPGYDITVIDTRTLSMGQGFIALAAAEAAQAGASKEEIIERALEIRGRTCLYAALSTLKYLAMSGRVGQIAAGIATVLDVKPIVTLRNGKLDMLERVRTRQKSWDRVIELAKDALGNKPAERLAILHVNAESQACQFLDQLRQRLPCPHDVLIAELTPGLSVHSGAGLVGLAAVAST